MAAIIGNRSSTRTTTSYLNMTDIIFLYSSPLAAVVPGTGGRLMGLPLLDVAKEKSLLRKTFLEADRSVSVRSDVATSSNLRRLMTLGCRAIHYTGHGDPGYLAFEDGRGQTHAISPESLGDLVGAGGSGARVSLAFVSACYSEAAGLAFVQAGVPHVVAIRRDVKVLDEASRTFAQQFYLALLVGKTVRESFDIAVSAVRNAPATQGGGRVEEGTFLLLPRDSCAHDEAVIFARDEVGKGGGREAVPLLLTTHTTTPNRVATTASSSEAATPTRRPRWRTTAATLSSPETLSGARSTCSAWSACLAGRPCSDACACAALLASERQR